MALLIKLDGLWEAKAALSIGVLGHQGFTLFHQPFWEARGHFWVVVIIRLPYVLYVVWILDSMSHSRASTMSGIVQPDIHS